MRFKNPSLGYDGVSRRRAEQVPSFGLPTVAVPIISALNRTEKVKTPPKIPFFIIFIFIWGLKKGHQSEAEGEKNQVII